MAVALDSAGTEGKTTVIGTTGISYTGLTIGAALTNGALGVLFGSSIDISTVAAVWDPTPGTNQTVTAIGNTVTGGGGAIHAFGLVAPTAGNKTLKITWNAVTAEVYVLAISWSGVDQTGGTTSFPHYLGTTGSGTASATENITSATNNAVMAMCACDNTVSSTSPTQIWTDSTGPTIAAGAMRGNGAATVTVTGTLGAAANWTVAGFDILAAAAGGDTLGGAMPVLMMSRRRPDPVKRLLLPSRYRRRTRGFAVAA